MESIEDRVRKLEAAAAYQSRQSRRITDALRTAAGQLGKIKPGASLGDVIGAISAAAGQITGILKDPPQVKR